MCVRSSFVRGDCSFQKVKEKKNRRKKKVKRGFLRRAQTAAEKRPCAPKTENVAK